MWLVRDGAEIWTPTTQATSGERRFGAEDGRKQACPGPGLEAPLLTASMEVNCSATSLGGKAMSPGCSPCRWGSGVTLWQVASGAGGGSVFVLREGVSVPTRAGGGTDCSSRPGTREEGTSSCARPGTVDGGHAARSRGAGTGTG